ncbi:MAG: 50S ribosomal protein L31 [Proteobacteria bacterium]|nr:50S ribosomal protein L31 [Pseudomonadota bacterium]
MKKDIHPEYYDSKIKCICGNVIETRAKKPEMSVEICSNCHPFYTGQQKIVDTEGRVERFNRKYGKSAQT